MKTHSSLTHAVASTSPLRRLDWLIALILASVAMLAGSGRMLTQVTGLWHDDAIYIVTAKSLADGDGYRITSLPDAPQQTKYPILWPAVLALVWRCLPNFPHNLWGMQAICLISCAGVIGLGYLYMIRFRYAPRSIAAATGLLCATTPLFLFFSTQAMSEMPFAVLVLVALWSVEKSLEGAARGRLAAICTGLLLTLPFWCRTVGLVFVLGGLLAIRRADRPCRWVGTGALVSLSLWTVCMYLGAAGKTPDPISVYYTDYLNWWFWLGLPQLMRVFLTNCGTLLASNAELGLEGCYVLLSELATDAWFLPCCLAAYLACLWLGFSGWIPLLQQARQGRVLSCCTAGYLLLIACWPWPPARFLVPMLPFLVMYMLLGSARFTSRVFARHIGRSLGIAALGVAVAANVFYLYQYSVLSHKTGCPVNQLADNPAYWGSYQRLFAWLRTATPANAVLATDKDPMFHLYTQRKAFRPFVHRPGPMFYRLEGPKLGTVEEFAKSLQAHRATYVVVSPMEFYDQPFAELISQLQALDPQRLRRVYRDPADPRFEVFAVDAHSAGVIRSAKATPPPPGSTSTADKSALAPVRG